MLENNFIQANTEDEAEERKSEEIKQESPSLIDSSSQPPPPPAPPPPPSAKGESKFFKEIRRLDNREVKWMKKVL